jgi:hypothetical protein
VSTNSKLRRVRPRGYIIQHESFRMNMSKKEVDELLKLKAIQLCPGCTSHGVDYIYHLPSVFGDNPISTTYDDEWAVVARVCQQDGVFGVPLQERK